MKRLSVLLILPFLIMALSACAPEAPPAPDTVQRYFADERIAEALDAMDQQQKAGIVESIDTDSSIVALTFDGMNDIGVMEAVINITTRYGIKVTFFAQGAQAAEYSQIIAEMRQAGHEVGSYTLYGASHMEDFSAEELVRDFVYSSVILEDAGGARPGYLKCRNSEYTDTLLAAAKASGFDHAVRSEYNLSYQSFSSYQEAQNYVKRLPGGAIVSLKLKGVLETGEYIPAADAAAKPPETSLKPAEEKKAAVGNIGLLDENERLLQVVEWLCQALSESGHEVILLRDLPKIQLAEAESTPEPSQVIGPDTHADQERAAAREQRAKEQAVRAREAEQARLQALADLRAANAGRMAPNLNIVHTTERAAAFIFYGIANGEALADMLKKLQEQGVSGTFFVSDEDIERYPERITTIIQSGNELGMALLARTELNFNDSVTALQRTSALLKSRYGIVTALVKQPFGVVTDQTREAASALGLTLVSHSVSAVQSADEYALDAGDIIPRLYTGGKDAVARGEIIYFRLDFYKASNTLVGELMQKFKQSYVDSTRFPADTKGAYVYTVKTVGALLAGGNYLYQYPLKAEAILPGRLNIIHAGQLAGLSEDEAFEKMRAGYTGSPAVNLTEMLPGFSPEQIDMLDHSGRIDTGGDRTIFLSFDDWGTDKSVNYLLYVLNKHQVKATFFVRTNYVYANPNLLRAIAVEGHSIASHTDSHYTLSNYDGETGIYTSLSAEQALELEADLIKSYETLIHIAGDLRNERGNPIVTRHFRAPTLAQSYLGMRTLFDCGFTYSISGDFSTGDYAMPNAPELLNIFNSGLPFGTSTLELQPGSNVVMHMSSNAAYTAEALDEFLTQNERKPAEERYSFARISDYLQP